jgi:recombination protein RecA
VAAPFREAEFDILYGEGISLEGDLLDLGVTHNVVEKSGTWLSFGGERIGQGRENARLFLKEHVDIRAKLESALRKKLGLPNPAAQAEASASSSERQPEKAATAASAAAAGARSKNGR